MFKLGSDLELGRLGLSTVAGEGSTARYNSDLGLPGEPEHCGSQPPRGGLSLPQLLCPCHQSRRRFYNNSFRLARRWWGLEDQRRAREDAGGTEA